MCQRRKLDAARRQQARREVRARDDAEEDAPVEDDERRGHEDGPERHVHREDVGVHHLAEQPRGRERPVQHLDAQAQ